MTRVLLLDVMGTLVHDPFYTELPAFFGLGLDELLRQKHPGSWLDYEYGRRGEQAFLDDFFADRRAYDQAGLRRAMFAAYRYLDGILPLLEELRRAGVEMHLVSNYSDWYRAIEERLALSRYAPWTFVSCEWGLRKPEPAVFAALLGRLGRPPEELLFVDDVERNCLAARAAGIAAHRFRSAAVLRAELRGLALL
ncbi:MAG: HAD-IA family hydrolase [Planctomycetes bacterium]|nr:HAD-IA family hydrolase [Planctomycetota bacterium]